MLKKGGRVKWGVVVTGHQHGTSFQAAWRLDVGCGGGAKTPEGVLQENMSRAFRAALPATQARIASWRVAATLGTDFRNLSPTTLKFYPLSPRLKTVSILRMPEQTLPALAKAESGPNPT
jgi:hypothetical protein